VKIETQRHDNQMVTLTVEVEDERVQPALRAAARRLSQNYRIPGFRPGKAPYETVARHLGEDAIYQEALDQLGQKVYEEALDHEKIEPYAPGGLEDVRFKPLVLTFNVPLAPEVDLGDYRALRVPYTAPTTSDEALAETLEHLREHHAILAPVERPAALGDVVTVDVKAFLNEGVNPSDFLMADQDVALLLDQASDWPLPGFAPHVVGLQAGEEKKFDLVFPEDYANASLRGEAAHLEVKVKEVKDRTLPEWSDELAKDMGEYESLDDLRTKVRRALQERAERDVEAEYQTQAVDKLVEQTTVNYPPVVLDHELDGMLEDLDHRLHEQNLTLDDYLKIEGKTREQLREEYTPQAQERLKRSLALGKLVELEQLNVSDAEVENEINRFSALFGQESSVIRKSLSSAQSRNALALEILTNAALKRLSAIARGEDVPLPGAAPEGAEAAVAAVEGAPAPEATPVPAEPETSA
jgi:trigger factor